MQHTYTGTSGPADSSMPVMAGECPLIVPLPALDRRSNTCVGA